MKSVSISVIVATCLVVCAHGLPGTKRSLPSPANNYEALAEISLQIRRVVLVNARGISAVAKNDSLEIGSRIEEKVNASRNEAVSIIDQLDTSIGAETLDLEEANELLQQLNETGVALRESISEDVQELSARAQAAIRGILIGSREAISRLADAARALLSDGVSSTQSSDKYEALARLSGELRLVSSVALNKAVEIAQNDSQEIGSQLRTPVDEALNSIASSLDELDAAIANQSLSLEEADPLLQQINSSLLQLNQDVAPLIEQLSLSAKAAVVGILRGNQRAVAGISQTIRIIIIRIPDEPSVNTSNQSELLAKLAAAIRATINKLADEVNEISRNDIAEVGESIAAVVNGARSSALAVVSVQTEVFHLNKPPNSWLF